MAERYGPNALRGANYRPDSKNPFPGFYRARVEFNRDPLKLGRVKIRVPQMHGIDSDKDDNTSLKTSELPWAVPGIFAGAGHDMGQFIVPEVGVIVLIAFEEGDPNKPVYFGGVPSSGGKNKLMNQIGDIPKDKSHPDYYGGGWMAGNEGDAPKDMYDGRTGTQDVTRKVIFKSPKGHTIYFDDTDGKEEIIIVDRIGQIIKMHSPVSVSDNKANATRRGTKRADKGSQLNNDGYILIQSGGTTFKVEPGKVTTRTSDSGGNVSTTTQTPSSITHTAPAVNVNGDMSISGSVSINGSLSVNGRSI